MSELEQKIQANQDTLLTVGQMPFIELSPEERELTKDSINRVICLAAEVMDREFVAGSQYVFVTQPHAGYIDTLGIVDMYDHDPRNVGTRRLASYAIFPDKVINKPNHRLAERVKLPDGTEGIKYYGKLEDWERENYEVAKPELDSLIAILEANK